MSFEISELTEASRLQAKRVGSILPFRYHSFVKFLHGHVDDVMAGSWFWRWPPALCVGVHGGMGRPLL